MYIPIPSIRPYPHQHRMFKAIMDGKNVVAIVHRRAGKDVFCIEAWLLRALQRVGTHVYLLPQQNQARSVVWSGMDYTGRPFMSAIPECLIEYKNEARMELRLINGSRLVLGGSNNYDSLMGSNPITIIYSEFALHHPLARQYLNPILIQNDGLEIIQSTPRSRNHLYEVYEAVKDNSKYHIEHLNVEETFNHEGRRIITEEHIDAARKMGMSEEMVRQEWYVDFDVGNVGSYFTREMGDMEREGRILPIKPNIHLPVHTVFDLGGTDATAGWLFQVDGEYINLLALLHDTGKGLKFYLEWAERLRQQWGCYWGTHFGPFDIAQRHQSWEQAESRLMLARKAGWHFQVTPKLSIEDGIEAMRYIFPKLKVNSQDSSLGVRAMREYRREYDEVNACFKPKPLHNWSSNIMDALRYLAINYRRLYDVPSPSRTYQYKE